MEAVLARGRASGRDLTPAEAATFDQLADEMRGLDAETPTQEKPMDRAGLAVLRAPAVHTRPVHTPEGDGTSDWQFGRMLALVSASYGLDPEAKAVDFGFEAECHQELVQRGAAPSRGGVMVPFSALLKTRDIGTLPGDPGAALTGQQWRYDLFQLDAAAVRAKLLAGRLGCAVLTAQEPVVNIPSQSGPLPTAVWIPRDSDATVDADITTRSIQLQPHTLKSVHIIKRSARMYGTPDITNLYRDQMVTAMNYTADWSIFYADPNATGGPFPERPSGLITQANLQKYNFGTGGLPAKISYLKLVDMASMLGILNVDSPRRGWLMSKLLELTLISTWKTMDDPTGTTGTALTQPILLEGSGMLATFPYVTGTQLPVRGGAGNKSTDLWVADWDACGILYFNSGAVEILPDPYTQATSGALRLITFQDADVFCRDATRFVLAQDGLVNMSAPPVIPQAGVPFAASRNGNGKK
jgi:hypothetical protein